MTATSDETPSRPEPGTPLALLIGPPGSGTSSVARELAALLGVAVIDTERAAAAALGHDTVATAFVVAGEDAFRAAELAAVQTALHSRAVVALGSAALIDPEVRAAVVDLPLVQLTVSLAHAAPRLGLSTARPVFLGNPRAQWARLAAERQQVYDEVARERIDTDDRTPAQVAVIVLAALGLGAATPAEPVAGSALDPLGPGQESR